MWKYLETTTCYDIEPRAQRYTSRDDEDERSLYRLRRRRKRKKEEHISSSLARARRLSNEILDLRSNICPSSWLLILNVKDNVLKATHLRSERQNQCYLSEQGWRLFNRLSISHINNGRALTCCSHRSRSKGLSRALQLIDSITLINFPVGISTMPRSALEREREERRSDLSAYENVVSLIAQEYHRYIV